MTILLTISLAASTWLLIALGAALAVSVALALVGKIPLGYNIRNLIVRWRTTLLAALAFTLVVALQTVMLAFVEGMYRLTDNSGHADNVLVLSDGATDEAFSNLSYSDTGDVDRQPGVGRSESGQPLASRETYLVVNQPVETAGAAGAALPSGRPKRRFIQVRGIEDPQVAGQVHRVELLEGRWFSSSGVQSPAGAVDEKNDSDQLIEAVLGEGVAGQLGGDRGQSRLKAGDVFALGPRKWIVVGVMKSAGSTFGSEVWAKWALVTPMFGKQTFTTIVLRSPDATTAKVLAESLSKQYKKAAVQATPENEYYAKLSETNRQFSYAIFMVTVIMAVGGMFGIANTMFAAVSQRTKDIGVLRILGFARWQILVSFFIESLAIALVGGLLGCGIGWLADGWTATSIVSSGQGGGKMVVLELAVTANILLAGILLSLVMGALGGLLPALSAMRLRPLESLK